MTWKPSMAHLLGSVGTVEISRKDSCLINFGNFSVWWPLAMLEPPSCPKGHLLHLAVAEFHICNRCGCGLMDSAAYCAECQMHFCSHCAQDVEILSSLCAFGRSRPLASVSVWERKSLALTSATCVATGAVFQECRGGGLEHLPRGLLAFLARPGRSL